MVSVQGSFVLHPCHAEPWSFQEEAGPFALKESQLTRVRTFSTFHQNQIMMLTNHSDKDSRISLVHYVTLEGLGHLELEDAQLEVSQDYIAPT